MSRFVAPQTRTLTLSTPAGQPYPDTLVVRRRLTAGEQRAMFERMYIRGPDALRTNPLAVDRSLCVAFLLDWSLVDQEGNKVEIAGKPVDEIEATLDALSPEDFREIREAIQTHQIEMDDERAAQKKMLGGSPDNKPTLSSPSEPAGLSSGSAIST